MALLPKAEGDGAGILRRPTGSRGLFRDFIFDPAIRCIREPRIRALEEQCRRRNGGAIPTPTCRRRA